MIAWAHTNIAEDLVKQSCALAVPILIGHQLTVYIEITLCTIAGKLIVSIKCDLCKSLTPENQIACSVMQIESDRWISILSLYKKITTLCSL